MPLTRSQTSRATSQAPRDPSPEEFHNAEGGSKKRRAVKGRRSIHQQESPSGNYSFSNPPTWNPIRENSPDVGVEVLRADAFKNSPWHKGIYSCSFPNILQLLEQIPVHEVIESEFASSSIMKIKIFLQKAYHNPSVVPGQKSLRAKFGDDLFTVLVNIKFEPVWPHLFELCDADEIECSFAGTDNKVELLLAWVPKITTLTSNQYKFIGKSHVSVRRGGFTGPGETDIAEWLDEDGVLQVEIGVNYRLAKFAYAYALELWNKTTRNKRVQATPAREYDRTIKICCTGGESMHQNEKALEINLALIMEASPVMKAAFQSDSSKEGKTGRIEICDFSYDTMLQFVNFIRYGPNSLFTDKQNIHEVAYAADKYGVFDMLLMCNAIMLQQVSEHTVLAYYTAACMLNLPDLKSFCLIAAKEKVWGDVLCDGKFWREAFRASGNGAEKALTDLLLFMRHA